MTKTTAQQSKVQGFTTDLDLTTEQVLHLLDLAAKVKHEPKKYATALEGKCLALLFEKLSLRTRLTFDLAMIQLGGDCVASIGPVAEREPVKDVARNLDRWVSGIVARVFKQETVDELAKWSKVPVINALSDMYHPCQVLADMQTVKEKLGKLEGVKLAFVGDGNNVCHSLLLTAARLGMEVSVANPRGYEPEPSIWVEANRLGNVNLTDDPIKAVSGAHVVYTDVWTSMGQEATAEQRAEIFAPYQVDEYLFGDARPDAIFMHCLPAKRGQEVTDAVMESPRSAVFDQAENRLHTQKALLLMLLGEGNF